jgi:transcriptional regulator GlxA family with amidase domain
VCSGSFLLAEAGLLEGRRVTTHWAACAQFARHYPHLDLDPEPIYTRDGDVWTSAGVTAGMDLALAIVEEDLGRDVALEVARYLVLFLRRPGGQSQFSAQLSTQLADRDVIRDLQQWMVDHPEADLSVEAMAERVAMSPRHFARRFRAEVAETPARYVERTRVEAARRRLEDSADAIERIAPACGFRTTETMRRAFLRALGVAPAEYRRRFQSPVPIP